MDETTAISKGHLREKQVHWGSVENSLETRSFLIDGPDVSRAETVPPS